MADGSPPREQQALSLLTLADGCFDGVHAAFAGFLTRREYLQLTTLCPALAESKARKDLFAHGSLRLPASPAAAAQLLDGFSAALRPVVTSVMMHSESLQELLVHPALAAISSVTFEPWNYAARPQGEGEASNATLTKYWPASMLKLDVRELRYAFVSASIVPFATLKTLHLPPMEDADLAQAIENLSALETLSVELKKSSSTSLGCLQSTPRLRSLSVKIGPNCIVLPEVSVLGSLLQLETLELDEFMRMPNEVMRQQMRQQGMEEFIPPELGVALVSLAGSLTTLKLPQLTSVGLPRDPGAFGVIAALPSLTKLKRLNLGFIDVGDMSFLRSMPQLEELEFLMGEEMDFTPMETLMRLRVLLLREKTELLSLDMQQKQILAGLPYLEEFKLIGDLGGPFLLPHVKKLAVWGDDENAQPDLMEWGQLETIEWHRTGGRHLLDLFPRQLVHLEVDVQAYVHCDVLSEFHQLRSLSLPGLWLWDKPEDPDEYFEFLGKLEQLEELTITEYPFKDATILSRMTRLRRLVLKGNEFEDAKPLAKLRSLEYLDVSQNPVSDVRALAELDCLEYLDLRYTQVRDVGPLAGLPNLRRLYAPDPSIWGGDLMSIEGLQARGVVA